MQQYFQTVVRIRPLLAHESQKVSVVELSPTQVQVIVQNQTRILTFDSILPSQLDISQDMGIDNIIEQFIQGYSHTIFAYGQTGSGKTFTIDGNIQHKGLVSTLIQKLYLKPNIELSCSFYQIYNEKILDLLNFNKEPLKLRYRNKDFYVQNLTQPTCNSHNDLTSYYAQGTKAKIVASHQLNHQSSRSHSIFSINRSVDSVTSQINIVDLAGSERATQTLAKGQQLIECIEINKSLLCLRQVIMGLASRSKHIPYRDSKLTSILSNSLQGNGYVTMIVCASPAEENAAQTLQSLTYGAKARTISIEPKIQQDPKSLKLQDLEKSNAQLQEELKQAYNSINSLNKIIEQLKQQNDEKENYDSQVDKVQDEEKNQIKAHDNQQGGQQNNWQNNQQNTKFKQINKTLLAQIQKQNQFIGQMTSNVQSLKSEKQQQDVQLRNLVQDNTQLVNENQDFRDRIIIFEEIISNNIKSHNDKNPFDQSWQVLFQLDLPKSSNQQEQNQFNMVDSIVQTITEYKSKNNQLEQKMLERKNINQSFDGFNPLQKKNINQSFDGSNPLQKKNPRPQSFNMYRSNKNRNIHYEPQQFKFH